MLDAVSQDQDYAARVAADVAARYGVAVTPAVVQRVAPGVSGLPQPVWDGSHLVYPDPAKAKAAWRRATPKVPEKRKGLADPVVHARRCQVAELHAQGKTDAEISAALGIEPRYVQSDRRHLRLKAHPPREKPPRTQTQIRVARIKEMVAAGNTKDQIIALLGISRSTLRNLAREAGIALAPVVRADHVLSQNRVALVGDMVAAGKSRAEIIAALGVGLRRARILAAKAGVALPDRPRPTGDDLAARNRARNAAMAEARRVDRHKCLQGMNVAALSTRELADAVARQLGFAVSERLIRADLRELGLIARDRRAEANVIKAKDSTRQRRLAAMQVMDLTDVTVAQLAAQFEVSEPQIRQDLDVIGKRDLARSPQEVRVSVLRERIASLAADGRSRKEIMGELRIADVTLYKHLKALGIQIARADGRRTRVDLALQDAAGLRKKICDLRQAGRSIAQISAAVDRSPGTVSYHLKCLGLAGVS